ncbi:MAG: hypothetical protein JJE04_24510 [Acidobacteriia bacterium]|nr:hypothetical protein [Terriglobia bacterium]
MALKLFPKTLAVMMVCAAQVGLWAQAPEKKVKDQAEYDLFTAVQKEADLNKKVQLLETWKQKYPDSDYKVDRLQILVQTYQGLGQGEKMYGAAKEILSLEPNNTFGLYMVTLLTESLKNTAADRLDFGEKATRTFIASLDDTFSAAKRPPNVAEQVWKTERTKLEIAARKTLVFIAKARKDNVAAEKEVMDILQITPNSGFMSYELGAAIVAQRKPEKQMAAIFHFARAAHYTGEDALPEATRKQVEAYLEKVYVTFHGSKEGLDGLVELARKSTFPPQDFRIKSAQEIIIEDENRLKAENPQLALWIGVKKELIGPNGTAYFEGTLKGAALPKLKGKVVSQTPAAKPKEILVALSTADTPEIKLRLETPMASKAEPGTEIEFEGGIAAEFVAEPPLLTLDIEKTQITGWPAAPRPAAAKPAGKRKKK